MSRRLSVVTQRLVENGRCACLAFVEPWRYRLWREVPVVDWRLSLKRPRLVNTSLALPSVRRVWQLSRIGLMRCESRLILIFLGNIYFQYMLIGPKVKTIVASPSKWIHSSMSGIGYESQTFTAITLCYWMQNAKKLPFPRKTRICKIRFAWVRLIPSMASIWFISCFSRSIALEPLQYGAEPIDSLYMFPSFTHAAPYWSNHGFCTTCFQAV